MIERGKKQSDREREERNKVIERKKNKEIDCYLSLVLVANKLQVSLQLINALLEHLDLLIFRLVSLSLTRFVQILNVSHSQLPCKTLNTQTHTQEEKETSDRERDEKETK